MSTDHQRYSTENQSEAIHAYAVARGMVIERTYRDEGKSGLDIEGRAALQRLLSDIESGPVPFEAVLVFDVSRWGRFQNADEAAFYEYRCIKAGVRVIYVAEPFENDGSPLATIVKGVKRSMAAEYSRELSAKVFAGQCRLAGLGFRQAGPAGFGLRRALIDGERRPKGQLEPGERKSIQTDRVILIPGPQDEVEVVRGIYRDFVEEGLAEAEIAERLNGRGIVTDKALPLDRAEHEHVAVMNPRVSIWIMTHEEVLKAYCGKRGKLAKGSGHWARYLVGYPLTTKGTRWVALDELVWEHLPKFHARIRELLMQFKDMMASGKVEREVIEFSKDAKARWIQQANNTEWMIRPGEYMSDIDDFASKTMELIARLAASMHYFAGDGGKISLDTLERAIEIVAWHVDEFKRLFAAQPVMPQEQEDAYRVANWLRTHVWRGWDSQSWVAKNHLLQYGPVRNRNRLNAALGILNDQFAIWLGQHQTKKTWFVNLRDKFFVDMAVA